MFYIWKADQLNNASGNRQYSVKLLLILLNSLFKLD